MAFRWHIPGAIIFLLAILASACEPQQIPAGTTGPRLIGEETLPPVTVTPLRIGSPTATPEPGSTVIDNGTAQSTQIASDFVTVTPPDSPTPSLTPSSTPTKTPTVTPSLTPSRTPSPTITLSPTSTPTITPTLTPTDPWANCQFIWFITPPPQGCPTTAPISSPASYQAFQGGLMIRIVATGNIYVLFNAPRPNAWLFAADTYLPGQALPAINVTPPPDLYQPIYGFGKIWASDSSIRDRLGWATTFEFSYTSIYQTEQVSGSMYIAGMQGEVFILLRDQTAWWRYR